MARLLTTENDAIAAYRLILNREPDPGEGLEKQGKGWNETFEEMLFCDEFRERRLPDLRETVFQRFTDDYVGWLDRYRSVIARFRSGETLSARSSDNAEFLVLAYLVLLQRLPDHMGFIDYLRKLEKNSLDRAAILEIVANSAEGQPRGELRRLFEADGAPDLPPETFELNDYSDVTRAPAEQGQSPGGIAIVSGPPRSGTTALTALLNAHPQVCITNESRIFSLPDQLRRTVLLGESSFSTLGAVEAISEILNNYAWDVVKKVALSLRKCRVTINPARAEVFRIPGMEPPLVVGDKNPVYLFSEHPRHLQIARELPSAKWIVIFRSPPDTLKSQLRLGMVHSKAESCDILRRCLESASDLLRMLGPGQCFITTHERLFSAATYAEETARLATFLHLPDHQCFAEFVKRQLKDPQRFSSAASTRASRVNAGELQAFFADQKDAPVFSRLISELKLWD